MPRTRNSLTGVIENDTPQHIIDHPVLGKNLVLVDDDAKPFVPELIVVKDDKLADTSKDKD